MIKYKRLIISLRGVGFLSFDIFEWFRAVPNLTFNKYISYHNLPETNAIVFLNEQMLKQQFSHIKNVEISMDRY